MGQGLGRAILGVVTAGVSEILRALTPQEQAQYEQAKAELERLKAEREEMEKSDVRDYHKREPQQYARFLEQVSRMPDPPKTDSNSAAFIGGTCCGKSSMINALFGTNCKISPLRCTEGANIVVDTPHLKVYDVFGANDEQTYNNAETILLTKTLHVVVCLYTDCVDSVLRMARLLAAMRTVHVIFVRNKMDREDPEDFPAIFDNDLARLKEFLPKCELVLASAKTELGQEEIKALIG